MNDQCLYQYAFALPRGLLRQLGPGVDPRFSVEWIDNGAVAAMFSVVGTDYFDPKKLEGKTAEDIAWLQQVAIRHSEVVCEAASGSPLLPLRVGTLFQSEASLLDTLTRFQATVVDFLQQLGDRQEWAVKLFLDKTFLDRPSPNASVVPPRHLSASDAGSVYLRQRRAELQDRRQQQAEIQQEIETVDRLLSVGVSDGRRVRPLPSGLTGREEKMVFNAAYLLGASEAKTWLTTVEQVCESVQRKGILLQVTGPWPPYHFCPILSS
jgi:hypothetical protein